MQDHYQILGVSRTASDAVIRIAYEGRVKALEKSELPDREKRAERRQLDEAYGVLSDRAQRAAFDAMPAARAPAEAPSRGVMAATFCVIGLLAAGGGWYAWDRARAAERARLDAERVAAEQAREREEAAEEARRRELAQARLEMVKEAEQAADSGRSPSRSRDTTRSFDYRGWENAANVYVQQAAEAQAQREQASREAQDRMQAEMDRRRAQQEVERQKQYLRQQELEEERARYERQLRAQNEDRERRAREEAEARSAPPTSRR